MYRKYGKGPFTGSKRYQDYVRGEKVVLGWSYSSLKFVRKYDIIPVVGASNAKWLNAGRQPGPWKPKRKMVDLFE